MPEILALLVSPTHRYDGRPASPSAVVDETVRELQVRAGLGVVGDRYFNQPAHRDASVSIMAGEALADYPGAGLVQTRRNVLLRGVDVDSARGRVLTLDSGAGPVSFRLHRPAPPCRWMDLALGAGAWKGLRGRLGMRCEPLDDGVLSVGPVTVAWDGQSCVSRAERRTAR